jgi:hypothetical protein
VKVSIDTAWDGQIDQSSTAGGPNTQEGKEVVCGMRAYELDEKYERSSTTPDLNSFLSFISYRSPRWGGSTERLPGMRKEGIDQGSFEQGHLGRIGERRRQRSTGDVGSG